MTDDARIARLTELARKAYGAENVADTKPIETTRDGRRVFLYSAEDNSAATLIRVIDHPRALDALEAALLVLATRLVGEGLEHPEERAFNAGYQLGVQVGKAYASAKGEGP